MISLRTWLDSITRYTWKQLERNALGSWCWMERWSITGWERWQAYHDFRRAFTHSSFRCQSWNSTRWSRCHIDYQQNLLDKPPSPWIDTWYRSARTLTDRRTRSIILVTVNHLDWLFFLFPFTSQFPPMCSLTYTLKGGTDRFVTVVIDINSLSLMLQLEVYLFQVVVTRVPNLLAKSQWIT